MTLISLCPRGAPSSQLYSYSYLNNKLKFIHTGNCNCLTGLASMRKCLLVIHDEIFVPSHPVRVCWLQVQAGSSRCCWRAVELMRVCESPQYGLTTNLLSAYETTTHHASREMMIEKATATLKANSHLGQYLQNTVHPAKWARATVHQNNSDTQEWQTV